MNGTLDRLRRRAVAASAVLLLMLASAVVLAAPPEETGLVDDALEHAARGALPVGGCGQAVSRDQSLPADLATRAAGMAASGWIIENEIWFGDLRSLSVALGGELVATDRAGRAAVRSERRDGNFLIQELRPVGVPNGTVWLLANTVESIACTGEDPNVAP